MQCHATASAPGRMPPAGRRRSETPVVSLPWKMPSYVEERTLILSVPPGLRENMGPLQDTIEQDC